MAKEANVLFFSKSVTDLATDDLTVAAGFADGSAAVYHLHTGKL